MPDLGRFQRGVKLPLSLLAGGAPDVPPVATLSLGGLPVGVFALPLGPPFDLRHFARTIRLWGGLILGSYLVTYLTVVGGVPQTTTDTFTLVAGGDSGGEVIALFAFNRPEGRYVLAQLGSGKLVQGANPHL